MRPVAVYLQERLQEESNHDSRVAVTLQKIGFEVHAVTREVVEPWTTIRVWEEPNRLAVIRRVARLRPDLLFCEGGAWHLAALPFARHTWVRTPTRSSSAVKDLVQRTLLKRADAVSICNPWERERWKSYRLVNLPYPLDTAFWSTPTVRDPAFWGRHGLSNPEGRLIICIGQIIERKKPVQLFEGLAPLLHERKDLNLLFVGETFEPSVEESLRTAISSRRLQDRVRLAGLIQPREELRQLLAWTDVHVLNTNWESQCMALYESLAAGVPTLIPDLPELTSAFPNLPAHRSDDDLRRNVERVLDQPDLGRKLVESSLPHLQWADNDAHDATVKTVCQQWISVPSTPASTAEGRRLR